MNGEFIYLLVVELDRPDHLLMLLHSPHHRACGKRQTTSLFEQSRSSGRGIPKIVKSQSLKYERQWECLVALGVNTTSL